jgi:hypothetical protein
VASSFPGGETFWVVTTYALHKKCLKLDSLLAPFPPYRSKFKSRLRARNLLPGQVDLYAQCINLIKIEPLAAELALNYWHTGAYHISNDVTLKNATVVGTITNTRTYPRTAAEKRPMTTTEKLLLIVDMHIVASLLGDDAFAKLLRGEFQLILPLLPSQDFLQIIENFYNRHYNVHRYSVFRCMLAFDAWSCKYHTYWHRDYQEMMKLTYRIPEFEFLLRSTDNRYTRMEPTWDAQHRP